MLFSALEIHLGEVFVGILFKYGDIIRLEVDRAYAGDMNRPTLSLSLKAEDPAQEEALLRDPLNPSLNSLGKGKLPAFFQNLLPEGVLRKAVAAERKCAEDDHFELLAACGLDLPGFVYARPSNDRSVTARILTKGAESLEMSVVDEPMDDGVSISGMQPKLALVYEGGRYVSGRRHKGGHIIGKLPTALYDLLPEVEHLSLELARAAGVNACETSLEPLDLIDADHHFTLGHSRTFLAVKRFDRDRPGRMHAEDFAQVLSIDPEMKYSGATYGDIGRVLMRLEGLGEAAVLELFRRIAVSELLGNYDFHVKNIGLLHFPDGRVELSPAYDIVAYSVYFAGRGHALAFGRGHAKKQILSPDTLRIFANEVGLPEPKLRQVVMQVCDRAFHVWPGLIDASTLMPEQKERLKKFVTSRDAMQSYMKRFRHGG